MGLNYDILTKVPVSQDKAQQRSGREATGKCFRLLTKSSFLLLNKTTPPEILKNNLASVVIQLKSMGIDDIMSFDVIDIPPKSLILASLKLLSLLRAIDNKEKLTKDVGCKMVNLPIEPILSKILLISVELGCSKEAIATVSMMCIENLFYTSSNKVIQSHFDEEESDHITMLKIFKEFTIKNSKEKKQFCKKYFLNYWSLKKAIEIET